MQISVIWLCGIMYLLAFVITLILVPFSIKLAHKTGAIDIPKDERRVHKNRFRESAEWRFLQESQWL